jgi:hypothetical protein
VNSQMKHWNNKKIWERDEKRFFLLMIKLIHIYKILDF